MANVPEFLKCLISFQQLIDNQLSSNQYDEKSYWNVIERIGDYIAIISMHTFDKPFNTLTWNILNFISINYVYFVIYFYKGIAIGKYRPRRCKCLLVLLELIKVVPDRNKLLKEIGQKLFYFLEDGFIPKPIKFEITLFFNTMLRAFDHNYLYEDFMPHLCKMADYLCICGYYNLQKLSIELILRICKTNTIQIAQELFPASQNIAQAFTKICKETFDDDARIFLNHLNKYYEHVVSLKANDIYLEKGQTLPHEIMIFLCDLWVDFNFGTKSIIVHCSSKSLSQNSEEDEVEFDVIVKRKKTKSIDVSFNKTSNSNNCEILIKMSNSDIKLLKMSFEQVPDDCNLVQHFSTLFPGKCTFKGPNSFGNVDHSDSSINQYLPNK